MRVRGEDTSIDEMLGRGQYSIKGRESMDPENAKEVDRGLGPDADL